MAVGALLLDGLHGSRSYREFLHARAEHCSLKGLHGSRSGELLLVGKAGGACAAFLSSDLAVADTQAR